MDVKDLLNVFKKGVGGISDVIKIAITTNSSAYSSGDCIGGVLTIASLSDNLTAILNSLIVKDARNQKPDLSILIFDKHPVTVGGATCTNNAPFVYGSSLPYQIGRIAVATTDYVTIDSIATACLTNLGLVIKSLSNTPDKDLYIVLVTTSTPTYQANSTDLSLGVGLLKD